MSFSIQSADHPALVRHRFVGGAVNQFTGGATEPDKP